MKAITKSFLLEQLKSFESVILRRKYSIVKKFNYQEDNENVLVSKSYNNVSKEGNSYFALIAPDNYNSAYSDYHRPWSVKYKVYYPEREQYAEVYIGGVKDKISYFDTRNIVGTEDSLLKSNIISLTPSSPHILGVNGTLNSDLEIEICETANCTIVFFENIESYSDIGTITYGGNTFAYNLEEDDVQTTKIEFSKSGFYASNIPDLHVIKEGNILEFIEGGSGGVATLDLAKVAYTGLYGDLIETPSLLDAEVDDEDYLNLEKK